MADFLRRHAPWEQLVNLGNISINEAPGGTTIAPWPGLRLRVFTVPHRGEYTDTLGVSINEKLLYVPDIDDWRAWPDARVEVEKHAVAILDGTFYSTNELPGRDLREIAHPFIEDTLAFFAGLTQGRRLVLTHFNHSNPVCDPASVQARRVQAAGFELSQEMMEFVL
jgi:pyrroloquinoline quinone biosynthesis protein B